MTKARYIIKRTLLADGRYCHTLVDTHRQGQSGQTFYIVDATGSRSPFAPSKLRKLQAKYNSRYELDKLLVF